jgi:hypothetical protein
MGVKFPPFLFYDVDKGAFRAFSRIHAVDVYETDMNVSGPRQRL